jgi:ADP-ribose pyrophosphatase YjhB (NUDIX family)
MAKIFVVSGPVIVKNDKVLLTQHGVDNFWKFPGGRVENLETEDLISVAKREAREEVGAEINIINPEPFLMNVVKDEEGEKIDVILVHYLAELAPDEKVIMGANIRQVKWLEIANLETEPLAPNILPVLKHFEFLK